MAREKGGPLHARFCNDELPLPRIERGSETEGSSVEREQRKEASFAKRIPRLSHCLQSISVAYKRPFRRSKRSSKFVYISASNQFRANREIATGSVCESPA